MTPGHAIFRDRVLGGVVVTRTAQETQRERELQLRGHRGSGRADSFAFVWLQHRSQLLDHAHEGTLPDVVDAIYADRCEHVELALALESVGLVCFNCRVNDARINFRNHTGALDRNP